MVYYSFYTKRTKQKEDLVFRTNTGYSVFPQDLKMFDTKDLAEKDFFKLLWDNEDYRIAEYHDTNKTEKKPTHQKEKVVKIAPVVEIKKREYPVYESVKRNFVYNEDCLLTMGRMPPNYVDYIITSPPYNVGTKSPRKGSLYEDYEDDLSDEEYEKWIYKVIDEMLRVTRLHVFFNIQMLGKNKFTVLKILGKYHSRIKDIIIWNKKIAPPHIQPGVMNCKFEFIIIFSNSEPHKRTFKDGNFRGNFNNVIEGMNASGNQHSKLNKATFPLYLPRTILNKFGKRGDLIYDPFNGTGTTAEGCVIEGRDYIGSELDPNQCEVTNTRILNEKSRIRIFE